MRPDILHAYFKPITTIKGVGPSLGLVLHRLVGTHLPSLPLVRDLLFHTPIDITDRSFSPPLHSAPPDTICTFEVTVDAHFPPSGGRFGSKKPYRVQCSNETGDIMLVFFHAQADWISRSLPVGQKRIISGKTESFDFSLQMTHPDVIVSVAEKDTVVGIEPVYPLTHGLTNKKLRQLIAQALAGLPALAEWYNHPPATLTQETLPSFITALKTIHTPQSEEDLEPASPARLRLAFDELTSEQLSLNEARDKLAKQAGILLSPPRRQGGRECAALEGGVRQQESIHNKPVGERAISAQRAAPSVRQQASAGADNISPPPLGSSAASPPPPAGVAKEEGLWETLKTQLPFTLTDSQHEVLADISTGLASSKRYIRLLQGDVGSGKTIIALFAMLRAVENGYQAALMVPTEIVAQQHYYKLKALCDDLDVRVAYLTGSIKGAERKQVLEDIQSGGAQIIIGTHALFQDKVHFNSLALAVIDEQHRFGVEQRMALVNKGDQPHILHMTATPIPRSLMMTQYGDMQPLYLREKPVGRLPITTRVVPASRSDDLLDRIQHALDQNEKIYWICPQIEASEQKDLLDQDIAAVTLRYTEFRTRFGDDKVALIHGRIPQAERDVVMRKFARGDIRMVVATTVIEVGVDVPDATIMIIESAQRFGLSQLHQLRGRVGRGDKQSYCILLYKDHADEIARTRLQTLRDHDDGFTIADMDLELRGAGELMGRRQSGGKSYHFVKPVHMKLLPEAHKVAREIAGAEEAEVLKGLFL